MLLPHSLARLVARPSKLRRGTAGKRTIAHRAHIAGALAGALALGAGTAPSVPDAIESLSSGGSFAALAGTETQALNPNPDSPITSNVQGQSRTYAEASGKLAALPIKGRAPKTGYSRSQFGEGWKDQDHNGCDTRNDILRRDLTAVKYKAKTRNCVVALGTFADKYTGTTVEFVRGPQSADVQIDHVVALHDAWQKGAQQLTLEQRTNFANDPLNLKASTAEANQSKGDGDAATWLPSNRSFRCEYVTTQIDVKAKYRLWVTTGERDAMAQILTGCTGNVPTLPPVPALTKGTKDVAAEGDGAGGTGSGSSAAGGSSPGGSSNGSGSDTGSNPGSGSNAGSGSNPSAGDPGVAPETKTTCPASAPIKGNQGSRGWIYHLPTGAAYKATHPEQCFATESGAVAAGYRKAGNS